MAKIKYSVTDGLSVLFQSPRSGKFVSDYKESKMVTIGQEFQSPRSGKFVSNANEKRRFCDMWASFNPLDRGNLYLILAEMS